ncbi:uridine kinase [Halalkalicoccus jeotgali]|uniref:Uridine kinase n=1 Tax=Halalkalicoccus jeotgali (strain DSM 18796 / CECT 7217 / JCM 14584 / KCTC 4019 / B3) TaxID=795797 RepID=D8J344_HALJB|nr:uridine kinase [Halalkalicoccus jeotgali]ADJ15151.1 uridine kinase [Halalkalicoccus jeotgali B3]ELY35129.1 uridine/cytidine kinase [Halalkalicoccus jeotgali B3]
MITPSFVLGIAGGTGAGKTTVTREVTAALRADDEECENPSADRDDLMASESVTHVPLDNYYADRSDLSFARRESINYDHPSAFDWELLRTHLDRLCAGRAVEMPQYDFEVHARTDERVRVEPADVIVVEGILALHDEAVTDLFDLRIYVETDADVRILRRIRRDVLKRGRSLEGVIEQYLSTVKPMHEQFVEPTKKEADLVIPEGANAVAVDLLEAAIGTIRNRRAGREPPAEDTGAPLVEYDD